MALAAGWLYAEGVVVGQRLKATQALQRLRLHNEWTQGDLPLAMISFSGQTLAPLAESCIDAPPSRVAGPWGGPQEALDRWSEWSLGHTGHQVGERSSLSSWLRELAGVHEHLECLRRTSPDIAAPAPTRDGEGPWAVERR